MRPRIQKAYFWLLMILVPGLGVLIGGLILGVSDEFSMDPFDSLLMTLVIVPFLTLVLVLLLSSLRIRISVDPQTLELTVPYWHATDGARPRWAYGALLFVQPLFSHERRISIEQVKSILVCRFDHLLQYRSLYQDRSVARAIFEYRIRRYREWGRAWVVQTRVFPSMPDVVLAVETIDDELIYRAIYTLDPAEVFALAHLIQAKHPSLVAPYIEHA
jgi:hypothetical protein